MSKQVNFRIGGSGWFQLPYTCRECTLGDNGKDIRDCPAVAEDDNVSKVAVGLWFGCWKGKEAGQDGVELIPSSTSILTQYRIWRNVCCLAKNCKYRNGR